MNIIKWDQATCSGCQIQLAQDTFSEEGELNKATTKEVVIGWSCPNCDEYNQTLYEYSGDEDTKE